MRNGYSANKTDAVRPGWEYGWHGWSRRWPVWAIQLSAHYPEYWGNRPALFTRPPRGDAKADTYSPGSSSFAARWSNVTSCSGLFVFDERRKGDGSVTARRRNAGRRAGKSSLPDKRTTLPSEARESGWRTPRPPVLEPYRAAWQGGRAP